MEVIADFQGEAGWLRRPWPGAFLPSRPVAKCLKLLFQVFVARLLRASLCNKLRRKLQRILTGFNLSANTAVMP